MSTHDQVMIESEFGVPIPGAIVDESLWARTGLKRLPLAGPLDFESIFGRVAPLIVELGCGNGRYTLLSAIQRPACDHIAVDLLPVVIRYATRRGNQRGLSNVRFAVKDAETFVAKYLGAGSAAEVHLYHPQPYHDPRERGRRLMTPRFLADVHRALTPGGLFVIQTDNADYWRYIRRIMPEFFAFEVRDEPWPDAPEGRSRREILARSRGLRVFRGVGVRRDDIVLDEAIRRAYQPAPPRIRPRGPERELDALERDG